MTADLEETLGALGADFRDFAVRFRLADAVCASPRRSRGSGTFRMFAASAAAAAVAAAAILPVFVGKTAAPETAAPRASEYVLAFSGEGGIDDIVKSQNADGGWANDYLTMQNAAALRGIDSCRVPYRRALRYLRSRGLKPLTDEEMRQRLSLSKNRNSRG